MKVKILYLSKENSIILLLGLSLGVVIIAGHYYIYWTDPSLLLIVNFNALLILGIGIPILFMSIAALQIRKRQAGVLLYIDSLKITFMVFVLGAFLNTINEFLFYNVIDLTFYDKHKAAFIQNRRDNHASYTSGYFSGLEAGGASEDKIQTERADAHIAEEDSDRFDKSWQLAKDRTSSKSHFLLGFISKSLFGLMLALFISFFLMQKPKIQME